MVEDMQQLTRITLAWEMYLSGTPKTHIAPDGLLGFMEDYLNAKKGEREKRRVDGLLKARIYRLREKYRDCCGQKIKEFLFDEYGISLSHTTIYKVLGEKYQLA